MESILGIVSPFFCAIAIVLIVFLSKLKQDKYRSDVLKTAIEHGRELPPDLFRKSEKPKGNLLTTALFFLGFGLGIGLAFYFFFGTGMNGLKYASIGLVFLFIGLGQLVAWLVERKQPKSGGQNAI